MDYKLAIESREVLNKIEHIDELLKYADKSEINISKSISFPYMHLHDDERSAVLKGLELLKQERLEELELLQ